MAGPSRVTDGHGILRRLSAEAEEGDLSQKLVPPSGWVEMCLYGSSSIRPPHTSDPVDYSSLEDSQTYPLYLRDEHITSLGGDKQVADWYQESHGKRVGYDDLTAIDWIFEYSKERQRVKQLAGSPGLSGTLKQLADASNIWIVLILTGIAVGVLAACMSIVSDWLADIKTGFCRNGNGGGKFYLSRQFCCWGHDDISQCQDWTPWRTALHLASTGGGYIVEYLFFVIFAVVFSLSAALLVKEYSNYAKQSGIPEIKTVLGGFVIRRFLDGWTLVAKSVGLVSGDIQVLDRPIYSLSGNEARKREILSAASAAGISVAFGAPVGGVLFSLEQVSFYFPDKTMWQSFVCAMVAAVTLQALNPFHTGKIVLYQVTYTTGWHNFEIVPFLLLGALGGIAGGLLIHVNMLVARFRNSDHNPLRGRPLLEVLVISVLSSLINYPNNFMRAQLSDLVYYLFAECATIGNRDIFGLCRVTTSGVLSMATLLITASVLGFFLASITFGLPIPSGIILPSLAIGALYGRALGVGMELLQKHYPDSVVFAACKPDVPCIIPGTYAIVGAAASLAGVTRLTASIVVIIFELTGALTYVLPIMIVVMLSKWIADAVSQKSIYEAWIQFNEYPYVDNKDTDRVPHIPASNIMTPVSEMSCLVSSKAYTIEELQATLRETSFKGYPIIRPRSAEEANDDGSGSIGRLDANILVGYISRRELSYALDQALHPGQTTASAVGRGYSSTTKCYFNYSPDAASGFALDLRPWTDQTPITLNVKSSFQMAVNMFQSMGLRYLLLVERGSLRGIMTRKDVWWILNASQGSRRADGFVPGLLREADQGGADVTGVDSEGQGLLHNTIHR
ncbi:hypothetical protein DV735_g3507, partial [Chaetothyriales sp. CBS 134920]